MTERSKKYRMMLLLVAVVSATAAAFTVANATAQVYPEGMVSYWKLDEGTGTTAGDSVDANHGILVNGPVWTSGQVDGALSFDGYDDRIIIPANPSLNIAENAAIEFWVRLNEWRWKQHFIGVDYATTGLGGIYVNVYGNRLYLTAGGGQTWTEAYPFGVHEWHHIVTVKNGTNGKIYIDGVEVAQGTQHGDINTQNGNWIIGEAIENNINDQPLSGLIDEVAIYNRALTAAEIQQHYQNGLKGLGYEEFVVVTIDIKPGSDPNCFNNNGHGVIPVAILTTDTFDASTVDPFALALDGMGVRVKGKSGNAGSLEDIDDDGDLDLVVQIEDTDGTFQEGDTIATVTGETFDGTQIQGTDTICIVP